MVLRVETEGSGDHVALLHGFTQNRLCWGRFGDAMRARFAVAAVDLPGHGASEHDAADLDSAATLVADAVGRASYVGYSMGGRVALHTALAHPEAIDRLVIIGATGGLDSESDRAARQAADERLAMRLEAIGVDAFLDEWLALPLFAGITAEQNQLDARRQNRLGGLAASLRCCGTGTQRPLWAELGQLAMPVTVIAGEHDSKFTEIGTRLVEAIGTNATLHVVEGAGHACHLEQPETTADCVTAALQTSSR